MNDENITNFHKIRVLTSKNKLSQKYSHNQVKIRLLEENVIQDYLGRDFVLFGDHSCLIIPSNPKISAYYNISPGFIETSTNFFETQWRT